MNVRLIGPFVFLATIVATAAAVTVVGFIGLVLPVVVFFGVVAASRPGVLLAVFWAATLFAAAAEVILPPTYVKIAEQGLGLYLLALVLGDAIISRRPAPGTGLMNKLVLLLLAVTGISTVVNRLTPEPALFFCLTYYKHLWVFYFVLRFAKPRLFRRIYQGMILTVVVQMLVNVSFYAGLNPIPRLMGRTFADSSLGTVGSAAYVGYMMVACVMLVFASGAFARTLFARLGVLIAGLVTVLQLYFTFTIHAYPVLGLSGAAYYVLFRSRDPLRTLRSLGIGLLAIVVLLLLITRGPTADITGGLVSVDTWTRNWRRMQQGPKWEAYREVFVNAGDHLPYPLLGGGPGNYTSRTAFLMGRPLAQLPHMFDLYISSDPGYTSARTSVLASPRTGYITLWGELGPAGMFLYWGMFVYAAGRVWRQSRRRLYTDPHRQILAQAFVPSVIAFLIVNALRDIAVVLVLNVGLWIWAAAVWNADEPPEDETPATGAHEP